MPRYNPYVMEIDQGRNCYSCGSFGHLVRNYRNRKIVKRERRLEYGNNRNNRNSNLDGEENLIVLN